MKWLKKFIDIFIQILIVILMLGLGIVAAPGGLLASALSKIKNAKFL